MSRHELISGSQKRSARKLAYILRYGITHTKRCELKFTSAFMAQLGACKSEEARRLLLGVSEKFAAKVPMSASAAVRVAA